jgi:hypothetical protein
MMILYSKDPKDSTQKFLKKNFCAWWGYIVAFTKVLTTYQIYHTWIYLLHHSPLSLLPSWNSFNRCHCSIYIHVYTVFAIYSSSYSFPTSSLCSCWYFPPHQTGPVSPSCSLILQKKNKWHFWLFKITTQGVSLWHFHVYMYYNPNWFISSIFLLSTLVPFLSHQKTLTADKHFQKSDKIQK